MTAGTGIDAYVPDLGLFVRAVGSPRFGEAGPVGYLDGDAAVYVRVDVASNVRGSGDSGGSTGIDCVEHCGVLGVETS